MPERLEYGGDAFPPGDREIWEEWYEGREGRKPESPSNDGLLGDPPGGLGHEERVAELGAEEEKVRQFMALPIGERRQILEEHYRQHPELLDDAVTRTMLLD